MNRIVLAYSGGLTTSVAIPWLASNHGAEVITVTLDLGQARELAAVRERALALGAVRAHVIDAKEEFVRDFIEPGFRAGLFTETHLDRTVRIAQPLLARRLVDMAKMESATLVAFGGPHGAALCAMIASLAPALRVLPLRHDEAFSGNDLTSLARQYHLQVPPTATGHVDATLWGRVVHLHDKAEREEAFALTRAVVESPSTPAIVEIDFVSGLPVRTNGVEMSLAEMIESLETIAGAHGVGRDATIDARVAVEAPAALVLQTAHQVLEAAALGPDLAALKTNLATVYGELIASGRWFSDVRQAIDSFGDILRPRVTGRVRLQLLRGSITLLDVLVSTATEAASPRAVA